jgi:flagellar protein FlbD
MIHLTRLNNRPLVVNADLIKFIENAPDTVITLLTGEKLVVRESLEEVLELVQEFQVRTPRRIAAGISAELAAPKEDSPACENSVTPPCAEKEKP